MSKQRQHRFLHLYRPVHDRFEQFCRARAYAEYPYEDLMNETLLIAYQKMDQVSSPASLLPFLIGISRKILANSRKKMRPINSLHASGLDYVPDPLDQIDQQYEVEFLHHALAKLPPLQQEALILFEITGLSIKEIMDLQKSTEAAVKQRLSRGRKGLKKWVVAARTPRKEESYE